MKILFRFWFEYAHKHRWHYLFGLLCLLVTNGLSVLIPKLIQWSIEALESQQSTMQLALALLLAGLGTMVVRTLSRTYIFNPGRTVEYDLKSDLFTHLMKLPRSFFEVHMSPGEIINRGSNDTAAVRALIGYGSLQFFNVTSTLILTLIQIFWMDFELSLYCILPLVVAAIILRWGVLQMFYIQKKILSQIGVLGDHVLEAYAGVNVIQSFEAFQGITARFTHENKYLLALSEKVQTIAIWVLPIVGFMGNICIVIILYIGGQKLATQQMSLGEITAFIIYINLLVSTLTSLGWLTGAIQRGYLSLGRLYEVLDRPIERATASQSLNSSDERGRSLQVKSLSFTYPEVEKETLKDISFTVHAGETMGVFGLTGSGKSTLLDVISRTYEPHTGQIFVDKVDITHIDVNDYWKEVGYVQQTPYLFSQSIVDNITWGQHIDEARLAYAIDAACLRSEIDHFPNKIHTQVGERGVTLSGGQKQRTSLARSFYSEHTRLLLLDDVLSAVDHNTEVKLIENLYQRSPACTCVIVSHRMSVLEQADRVLVLDQGRVVDLDTPQNLVQKKGLYAQAWQAQQEEFKQKSNAVNQESQYKSLDEFASNAIASPDLINDQEQELSTITVSTVNSSIDPA
jgi:ATP-binding cassette, subfamily B, multidrug efflux pump